MGEGALGVIYLIYRGFYLCVATLCTVTLCSVQDLSVYGGRGIIVSCTRHLSALHVMIKWRAGKGLVHEIRGIRGYALNI